MLDFIRSEFGEEKVALIDEFIHGRITYLDLASQFDGTSMNIVNSYLKELPKERR